MGQSQLLKKLSWLLFQQSCNAPFFTLGVYLLKIGDFWWHWLLVFRGLRWRRGRFLGSITLANYHTFLLTMLKIIWVTKRVLCLQQDIDVVVKAYLRGRPEIYKKLQHRQEQTFLQVRLWPGITLDTSQLNIERECTISWQIKVESTISWQREIQQVKSREKYKSQV